MRKLFESIGRLVKTSSPEKNLANKVCKLVSQTLDVPPSSLPVGLETRLYGAGLGVDSLDGLRLIAALEEEFDIAIQDEELTPANFETVSSIVSLVRRLRQAP